MMETKIFNIYESPFYFRINMSTSDPDPKIFLQVHGWSGNEKSMSIFDRIFPINSMVISPRGNLQISDDQFGWVDPTIIFENEFEAYSKIANDLFKATINVLHQTINLQKPKINLIGFSQGSAICIVMSLLHPEYFSKIALLSGYLPRNTPKSNIKGINNIQYFISHGIEDQIVNFSSAIEIEGLLKDTGAKVDFCTSNSAHKVSSECLRNLMNFFNR